MFQPRQFGKYTLVDRLAVGGMAEVFKARAPGLKRSVVVKQILPQYARDKNFVEMFIEEAKLSVMLTHANVVAVYELGRIDDVFFLVMEYVRGHDLADALQAGLERGFMMEPELAVYIAQQVCVGLDHAHQRTDGQGRPLGIVHRDLSPPNVLISFDGEVKITDFGIAKATDRMTRTEAGLVRGTRGYMSPEHAAGQEVDARADLFSVGVLLWEMLTMQRLFVEKSELLQLRAGQRPPIVPPSRLSDHVSHDLDQIVMKALELDPALRFQSAGEMGLELGHWLSTRRVAATPDTASAYMRNLFRDEFDAGRVDTVPDLDVEIPTEDIPIRDVGIRLAGMTPPPRAARSKSPPAAAAAESTGAATPRAAGSGSLTAVGDLPVKGLAPALPHASWGRGLVWLTATCLIVLTVVLVVRWQPQALRPVAQPREHRDTRRRYGDVSITTSPPGASVYLQQGPSPVEIAGLDVGLTHELLVLDGEKELRARLTPDLWKAGAAQGSWLADLHIDLARPSQPPLDDLGIPKFMTGTAHIDTQPAGRDVWLRVGVTPHVRMDDLPLAREYEFLILRDGYRPEALGVGRSDWKPTGLDSLFARHVQLTPLAAMR